MMVSLVKIIEYEKRMFLVRLSGTFPCATLCVPGQCYAVWTSRMEKKNGKNAKLYSIFSMM
nr:hypothetical protein [uncultured Janthinobacterium sp.]